MLLLSVSGYSGKEGGSLAKIGDNQHNRGTAPYICPP